MPATPLYALTGPRSSRKVQYRRGLKITFICSHDYAARLFNSSPISPRRCRVLLTKIALLLFTGERFPTNEATSLFFGISKLFQNKDASLRQMVYLIIKELANSAEDVIMVTSSIMKDTAVGSDVLYRANAIRALCRIIDVRVPASSLCMIESLCNITFRRQLSRPSKD